MKNVDILLNNAGMVIGTDPLVEVEESVIDQMLATNVKGLVFLTQALVPGMKKRGVGHVINLGSIAGKQAYAGGSIYCGNVYEIKACQSYIFLTLYPLATKFAVDAITKALAIELVDTPIRVSQICPGMVNTEFSTIRFRGDKDKADNVYKGLQPLVADDIGKKKGNNDKKAHIFTTLFFKAELIVFTASRPAHVNIADMLGKLFKKLPSAQKKRLMFLLLVFPVNQADSKTVYRRTE